MANDIKGNVSTHVFSACYGLTIFSGIKKEQVNQSTLKFTDQKLSWHDRRYHRKLPEAWDILHFGQPPAVPSWWIQWSPVAFQIDSPEADGLLSAITSYFSHTHTPKFLWQRYQ